MAQHPEAKDTLEGIMTWWLAHTDAAPTAAEVKAGLGHLIAQGVMQAESGPDGRIYYCHAAAESKSPARIGFNGNGNAD